MGQPAHGLQMRGQAEGVTQLTSEVPPDEQLLLLMVSVAAGTVSPSLASAPAFFSPTLTIDFTGACCLEAAWFWEWELPGWSWWDGLAQVRAGEEPAPHSRSA